MIYQNNIPKQNLPLIYSLSVMLQIKNINKLIINKKESKISLTNKKDSVIISTVS